MCTPLWTGKGRDAQAPGHALSGLSPPASILASGQPQAVDGYRCGSPLTLWGPVPRVTLRPFGCPVLLHPQPVSMAHIGQLFSRDTEAIFFNYKQKPVQRMLDFDYLCGAQHGQGPH